MSVTVKQVSIRHVELYEINIVVVCVLSGLSNLWLG